MLGRRWHLVPVAPFLAMAALGVQQVDATPGFPRLSCDAVLPVAPPPVIDLTGQFSYRLATPLIGTDGWFVELEVLVDSEPAAAYLGRVQGDTATFSLDVSAFPHDQAIEYRIIAENRAYVTGESYITLERCSTVPYALLFIVSSLSPSDMETLSTDTLFEFMLAAASSFNYTSLREGRLTTDRASMQAVCDDFFDPPTPCDWASDQKDINIGSERVPPPVILEAGGTDPDDLIGVLGDAERSAPPPGACATIRLADEQVFYNEFEWTDPGLIFFAIYRADVDGHTTQSRLYLHTELSSVVAGSRHMRAAGNVGYGFAVTDARPEAHTTFTILPSVNYTLIGESTVAVTTMGRFLGTADARARMKIDAWSMNVTDNSREWGGTVYDEDAGVSTGILGLPSGDSQSHSRTGVTVGAPNVVLDDTEIGRVWLRGEARSNVDADFFAGGRAETDVGKRGMGDTRNLRINYVDLTMAAYPHQWWAPSACN